MANNYASGTFAPYIPANLITDDFRKLADAVGLSIRPFNDDGDMVYLFNCEDYCTSGYIEEDGTEKEVTDEDLYAAIQDIIRNSEGKLTWVSHEQAYTCDKMRSGEFGGSAVFITADDIQYHGTSSWLEQRIHEAETGDMGPGTEDIGINGDLFFALSAILDRLDHYGNIDPVREEGPIEDARLVVEKAMAFVGDEEIKPKPQRTLNNPEDTTVNVDDAIEATNDLIEAAKVVVERWESGNLAEAVANLNVVIGWTEQTLDELKNHKSVPEAWEPSCLQKAPVTNQLHELILNLYNSADNCGCEHPLTVCDEEKLLAVYLESKKQKTAQPPHLAVVLDGGLVQSIVSDNPEYFAGVKTMVIDYDTDSLDPKDETLGLVEQDDGAIATAYIRGESINAAGVNLEKANAFIEESAYGATQQRFAACGDNPCKGCPDKNSDGEKCVNQEKCLAWQFYAN